MRINVPTNGKPVKDVDVRALYVISCALELCSRRMILPTLAFFAERYGYTLERKP